MLSEADRARVDRLADDVLHLGLSTARCDRPRAEGTVAALYRAVRLKPPARVVWFDSPIAGVRFVGEHADEFADEAVVDAMRQVRWDVERDVEARLGVEGATALRHDLWELTNERLWSQLWRDLRGRIWSRVARAVDDHPTSAAAKSELTGSDVGLWRDGYDLVRLTGTLRIVGMPAEPRLTALFDACRQNGWWWPKPDVAVLTDRPTVIERDEQGRPHSGIGPAVAWADGCELFYWHGTLIPEWVTQAPTVEAALAEPNAEVRRCAIEAIGWPRFIAEAGLVKVAECPDPWNAPHALSLWDLPPDLVDTFGNPTRILLCSRGTPDRSGVVQQYGLTVPAHHDDPVAAVAELYDTPVEAYRKLQIRT